MLVPATRIFAMSPPAKPQWPFIRYGSPVASQFQATCWDGASSRVTLHSFAETTTTYAGEDRALDIASAIVSAMETFDPDALGIVECEWVGTQCVRDTDEADKWHAWCEFEITAIRAE